MRVAFLHPDLGLGGAERLIVDAAAGLAQRVSSGGRADAPVPLPHIGALIIISLTPYPLSPQTQPPPTHPAQGHAVTVYTNHYEPTRSFAETRDGSFSVRVRGAWIPRSLLGGRLHILCALAQNAYLALRVALAAEPYDAFVCDQVSVCVPILRLLRPSAGVVFYCHFPDQLLAPRRSLLRRLYRLPFDTLEEATTGLADVILVNSEFTRTTFRRTFRLLADVDPRVLYPCISIPGGGGAGGGRASASAAAAPKEPPAPQSDPVILLSINRFERKKAIGIAIRAAGILRRTSPDVPLHLVVAGGYDTRVQENVQHHQELVALAQECGLIGPKGLRTSLADIRRVVRHWPDEEAAAARPAYAQVEVGDSVTFVRSFTDAQKRTLLEACSAVLYTPTNEHFGIVPLECMAAFRPVIACASGGPLESVKTSPEHERAGFLCAPEPQAFAEAMMAVVSDAPRARQMGRNGYAHVRSLFSRDVFARDLDSAVASVGDGKGGLAAARRARGCRLTLWILSLWPLLLPLLLLALVAAVLYRDSVVEGVEGGWRSLFGSSSSS
jgi:alpha-1,3/alpha-1,6-mannosyltransferase